ncbi:MAG: polysaccharide pyruvyl transferase family protein [Pseudomonadota bacterium]
MARQPIKLFWSRGTAKRGGPRNAGDWYAPQLIEHLTGRRVAFAPVTACDLVSTGSLLDRLSRSHRLHRLGLRRRLTIWGTGTLAAEHRLAGQHRVCALRGALTRERVSSATTTTPLGDPGLLAGELLERRPERTAALGVVVHQAHAEDRELGSWFETNPWVKQLPATLPLDNLLPEIARCEALWSTSLHGLIFADALGVPNRWIDRPGLVGGRFKFDDYYSAFGLRLEPLSLSQADPRNPVDDYLRPGLAELQAGLRGAFPEL